jgi:predicted nucleic acid-binding protein
VIIVPAIWRLEVVNALVVAERRKRITRERVAKFVQDLLQFPISVDPNGLDEVFTTVLELARLHQRSAYDASYLALARRRSIPLATRDLPLRVAARELGIAIFEP